MIVRKSQDIEATDVGDILGIPKMGINIQWLIHKELGDDSYGHRFALRRFTFEPGKSYPMHHHKYVEGVYIMSGKAFFETETEKVEVGPGDVIYTYSEEPHALGAVGDEPVELICTIDCVDGGENCTPQAQKAGVVLEEKGDKR